MDACVHVFFFFLRVREIVYVRACWTDRQEGMSTEVIIVNLCLLHLGFSEPETSTIRVCSMFKHHVGTPDTEPSPQPVMLFVTWLT